MGMFDTISGEVICPKCNKETKVQEQIKFANCILTDYKVGDKIYLIDKGKYLPDGIYTQASYARPQMYGYCEYCDNRIPLAMEVKRGRLKRIFVLNQEVK